MGVCTSCSRNTLQTVADETAKEGASSSCKYLPTDPAAAALPGTLEALTIDSEPVAETIMEVDPEVGRANLKAELLRVLPGELFLHESDITLGEKIRGASGYAIRKGTMRTQECAVKVISKTYILDVLKTELMVLGTLRHPNLVGCLGFALETEWRICLEFCPSTLRDAIREQCCEELRSGEHSSQIGKPFEHRIACAFALMISRGIAHLHAAGFVHGDLKPENILISTEIDEVLGGVPCLKLANFDTVKDLRPVTAFTEASEGSRRTTPNHERAGTPEYFSPDRFAFGEVVGTDSDLWAFGLMVLELLAPRPGAHPWDEKLFLTQIKDEVCAGHLPVPVDHLRPGVYYAPLLNLAQDCLSMTPSQRPTAEEVVQRLEKCSCRDPG